MFELRCPAVESFPLKLFPIGAEECDSIMENSLVLSLYQMEERIWSRGQHSFPISINHVKNLCTRMTSGAVFMNVLLSGDNSLWFCHM